MSTRCQIGFYDSKSDPIEKPTVLLYRHCDGYEDGVLPHLEPFVRQFLNDRGWDIEYIPARALVYLIATHTEDLPSPTRPFGGVYSYGICAPDGWHGDIEYYYATYEDRIEVYETPFDAKPSKFKKIKSIDLTKPPKKATK